LCYFLISETATNSITPTTTTDSQSSLEPTERSTISTVAALQTSTSAVFNASPNADSNALLTGMLVHYLNLHVKNSL